MSESKKTPDPKTVKDDAKGALAPSQADSKRNGALTIDDDVEDLDKPGETGKGPKSTSLPGHS